MIIAICIIAFIVLVLYVNRNGIIKKPSKVILYSVDGKKLREYLNVKAVFNGGDSNRFTIIDANNDTIVLVGIVVVEPM
jgi:hypothetical protein